MRGEELLTTLLKTVENVKTQNNKKQLDNRIKIV